jgi:hypothetical protein
MHPAAPTSLFLDTFQHYIGADNIERVSGMNVAYKAIGCTDPKKLDRLTEASEKESI